MKPKPRIVTLQCMPVNPEHDFGETGSEYWDVPDCEVPVPDGWELHTVVQAGQGREPGSIRLQALIVPAPDTGLTPA